MIKKPLKYLPVALLAASISFGASQSKAHDGYYQTGECRGYQQNVWFRGHQKLATGTACLQRNGEWVITSSSIARDFYNPAGPIILLPAKYEKNKHKKSYKQTYYYPNVIYKSSPTVTYKNHNRPGWAYQAPINRDNHHHDREGHKNNRQYHSHDRDDSVSFTFKW